MPVGTNPNITGQYTVEYSTNSGSAYTSFNASTTQVVDVIPDEWARKIIERFLIGEDVVLKYVGKINYGNIRIILEYDSAQTTVVLPWLTTRNTDVWFRLTAPDTGGTNGDRLVFKTKVQAFKAPQLPGDDQTAQVEIVGAVYGHARTAAA